MAGISELQREARDRTRDPLSLKIKCFFLIPLYPADLGTTFYPVYSGPRKFC
jgi:hypothetical protein